MGASALLQSERRRHRGRCAWATGAWHGQQAASHQAIVRRRHSLAVYSLRAQVVRKLTRLADLQHSTPYSADPHTQVQGCPGSEAEAPHLPPV